MSVRVCLIQPGGKVKRNKKWEKKHGGGGGGVDRVVYKERNRARFSTRLVCSRKQDQENERERETFASDNINPLSTGQSKIGRRRPISLNYHCVNISQRILISKISLERSVHYLNADTLFLKIGQEMTPLQPFEVTQLIDFALDRSTSVTCGRNFAHSITTVT